MATLIEVKEREETVAGEARGQPQLKVIDFNNISVAVGSAGAVVVFEDAVVAFVDVDKILEADAERGLPHENNFTEVTFLRKHMIQLILEKFPYGPRKKDMDSANVVCGLSQWSVSRHTSSKVTSPCHLVGNIMIN